MKETFVVKTAWKSIFDNLSDKQAGILIKAVFEYMATGEIPAGLADGEIKMALRFMAIDFDAFNKAYESRCATNRENGRKGADFGKLGGRPSKEDKTPKNPEKPRTGLKNPLNDNDYDNDLEKEKIQKEKDGIDEPSDQPANPVNNPPTHAAREVAGSAAAAKEAKAPDPDFEAFWEAYGKKRGRRDVEAYWARLPARDKAAALSGVPGYVAANPDPAYRKDPIRYLRHRCWEDENYSTTDKKPNEPHDTERPTAYMGRYF